MDSSIINEYSYFFNFITLLICTIPIFIDSGKAPFDLIEAESELIDGLTTEIGGIIFSLIFAAESVLNLINIKAFFIVTISCIHSTVIYVHIIIYIWYFGRISYARWRQNDTLEFIIITLLLCVIYLVLGF